MSESQSTLDVQVLVIGAGPTGLMMASELARQGIRCRVVDKSPGPAELSKALAIHARTLEVFEHIGIVDRFVTDGVKAHGGSIYADGKRIVHFSFDGLESRYNYALMIPQNETEALLGSHVESLGLKVERSTEMIGLTQDADSITATLRLSDGREDRCRAAYLVGCDGAHSTVRHALNLSFEGAEYEESFALADIRIDSTMPDDEIIGFASERGIVFFFPITHGRYRMMADVESIGPGEPSVADLQKIVDEQCHFPARLHDPKWTAYFKIHRRQAASYRVGRAFLAGDAAHIHSPAGGQGMNTGLQDAYNLAWKLAASMKGIVKPAVLDSYAFERHAVGKQVLKATDTMTQTMELRNPVAIAVRNRLVSAISSTEIFQSMARRTMAELDINYRQSTIVSEYHEGLYGKIAAFGGGPRAGDRAPDAEGLRVNGKTSRLYELLRGDNHKLLLFDGAQPQTPDSENLVACANTIAAKYAEQITTYLVTTDDGSIAIAGWNGTVVIDGANALHRAYHAVSPCAYLIRPDGYVAYRSYPAETTHLLEYLQQIFA